MSTTEEKRILPKLRKAKEKRQLKDAGWTELDKFDRGEQYGDAPLPSWIPKPVTNMVHLIKTTKRAAFAMENPTGKLRPLTSNDVENIEKLQKAYEYEWQRTASRKVVREVLETGKLLGTGISQVFWEENTGVKGGTDGLYEGEITVKHLDISCFYPDPNAFDLDSCRFAAIIERKSKEWLKKHPKFKDKMGDIEATQTSAQERGDIYNRDDNSLHNDDMVDFTSFYEKLPNTATYTELELDEETGEEKEVTKTLGGFKFKVTYLVGDKIIHTIENLKPNRYPFSVYYDFPQRKDFWGKATCGLVLDNQKLLNKVESIIAMIGTHLQNPQQIISKQSGINPKEAAKFSTAPGHTFVANGDISRAIIWKTPPQIPNALFSLANQAKENIREITGITDAYMGNAPGSVQTSSGVNSLIERATMRDRDQMYDLELFIEDLSRNILAFMTEFHTTERFARVLGEDGINDEFVSYLGTEFKGMNYDFHIDVSSKAPITRQRLIEEADKLLNIQGQYQFEPAIITSEEYINMSMFSDKDKILKRMEYERKNNKIEFMTEIATMMHEAMMNNVPEEEVQQMATAMIEQRDAESKGTGSASNSGQMQQRQAGL